MVYFDTSALVPLFILEPRSKALIDWLESSREPVLISEWAIVEFAAAMSMKVRMAHP
jgi:predicted nucleic acid-binding protein